MDATSSSAYKLSLQPTVPHEHDPSEHTARPGNAQRHAMWLLDTQNGPHHDADDGEPMQHDEYTSVSTPGLSKGLSRPLTPQETDRLAHLDRLKFFLATAPSGWEKGSNGAGPSSYTPDPSNPALNRFLLPTQEFVTCVLWNGLYHITGTDIVRALIFPYRRFEAFGRPVRNMKKFEEGVFSDLRNLKPGVDACLEEPKSPFLDLLFKYQCIRTQKKQKVFYWFSVPHDRLFLDALERDLKREKMGMEPTTVITGEPAILYEQFTGSKSSSGRHASSSNRARRSASKSSSVSRSMRDGEGELEWNVRRLEEEDEATLAAQQSPFFSMFSLFEGSPTYKQRRKKANHGPSSLGLGADGERGRTGYPNDSPQDDPMTGGVQVKRESISAADMFMKQARGELGQPLAPSASSLPKVDMRDVGVYVEGRLVSGGAPNLAAGAPAYPPSFDNYGQFQQTVEMADPTASAATSGAKTKVFVCPLLSCGRMFKRMEHLKRHLRTHTMERPFVCDKCGKKFSRSDNLGQHMRVHGRSEAQGDQTFASGNGEWTNQDWGDWINSDGEEGSGQEDDFPRATTANIGVGLGMYGGLGVGMGMGHTTAEGEWAAAASNVPSGDMAGYGLNVEMCEVEIAGDLREVPGDEEGLVTEVFASDYQNNGYPPPQAGTSGYYATHPQQQQQQWSAPPASAPVGMYGARPMSSAGSSGSGSMYGDDSLGDGAYLSMSAPSHKQVFDHASLYPPGVLDNSATGGGPVRRHRSMTPSLMRNGSGDSAGPTRRPGTSSGESPVPRGFHPYAHAGYSSTQSSPSMYPVGLPGSLTRRSSSRASSNFGAGVEEQMRQMMRSDSGGSSSSRPGSALSLYGGDMYRTDSPSPFGTGLTDSPAAYPSELPPPPPTGGGFPGHAATVPGNGNFFGDAHFGSGGAGSGGDPYHYAHPQHEMFPGALGS
ncbi:STE-domain-containing protein [Hymenopellis radicata]|nr:STE-domain-containing protein [Hymenopellis radicata]